MDIYDTIIIGGGPGGITAGIYAVRAGLETLIIEKAAMTGGQIADSSLVENWPSVKSASGQDLLQKFADHAAALNVQIKTFTKVNEANLEGEIKILKTNYGDFQAKTVIIATGASERKLGVPGESKFKGRGVSYCAVCDAAFFRDKEIAVIGGGDSAIDEGLYLTKFASKVHLIHRRDKLRATKILRDRALKNEKMAFHWNKQVLEILGRDNKVSGIKLKDKITGEESILKVPGVFIYVGTIPNSQVFNVEKDERDFIKTNEKMETNLNGVFAVGDVRTTVLRQVITASSDGAIAATYAEKYISK